MKQEDALAIEKTAHFFHRTIEAKRFAKYLRRFSLETIKLILKNEDDSFDKEWITDGHFWINEFCEILDPQLEEN